VAQLAPESVAQLGTVYPVTTILLIILTTFCFGQNVKQITVKFPKTKQISQSYFVLKSDKKIKNGEYVSYFRLSKTDLQLVENEIIYLKDYIKEKGNYLNNKKEGEWIENMSSSKSKKGKYVNGKKTGIWSTFLNGEKIAGFNYDLNKKTGIWLTRKENGRVFERYDYDKNVKLQPIIRFNISYPNIAKENGIQGIVKISYQVNSDCSINNIRVVESLSKECDQAGIDAVKEYGELFKKYGNDCENKTEEKEFNFKMY